MPYPIPCEDGCLFRTWALNLVLFPMLMTFISNHGDQVRKQDTKTNERRMMAANLNAFRGGKK